MYANTVETDADFDAVFPKLSVIVALIVSVDVSATVPDTVRDAVPALAVFVPAVPSVNVIVAVLPETLRYVPVAVPDQFVGVVVSRATEKLSVGAAFATYVTEADAEFDFPRESLTV